MVAAMAKTIEAHRDQLCTLDAKVGDGDHGINLATAVTRAADKVHQLPAPLPDEVMRTVGSALINDMGGASGVLFGSFFRGGSRAIKGVEGLELPQILIFMEAGLAEVQKRGKAQPGDKTFVDALFPAVEALQTAVKNNTALTRAMTEAAQAAQAGAERTTKMVAKFGRAKFLGERAVGHQDAGAASMALILSSWAEHLNSALD